MHLDPNQENIVEPQENIDPNRAKMRHLVQLKVSIVNMLSSPLIAMLYPPLQVCVTPHLYQFYWAFPLGRGVEVVFEELVCVLFEVVLRLLYFVLWVVFESLDR